MRLVVTLFLWVRKEARFYLGVPACFAASPGGVTPYSSKNSNDAQFKVSTLNCNCPWWLYFLHTSTDNTKQERPWRLLLYLMMKTGVFPEPQEAGLHCGMHITKAWPNWQSLPTATTLFLPRSNCCTVATEWYVCLLQLERCTMGTLVLIQTPTTRGQ